ncbi:MAG: secretin N-terminal domain-containing protein [Candidatus Omnitrophota bacterium]
MKKSKIKNQKLKFSFKILNFTLLFCIFIFAFYIFSYAQDMPQAPEQIQAQVQEVEQPASTQEEPEVTPSSGNVTFDFKDADIRNVLRILSYKSGVNIVADPEITGLVTIRLVDVPWKKALEAILKTQGFGFEEDGRIIRVTTVEKLKENITTEAFHLEYATAKAVAASISEMKSPQGKIKYDERSNTVIVTDVPNYIYKIGEVIKQLDSRTPQVMIDAQIIETTLGDQDKLGIDWTMKVTIQGAARPTSLPFQNIGLRPFDRKSNNNNEQTFGATNSLTEKYFPTGSINDTIGFPNYIVPSFPSVTAAQFLFGTLNFHDFQAVLEILNSKTNTKILSHPLIATLNNQEANIIVGEIIPIPTYERNTETGTMEITGYTEKQVGIKLNVTPTINEQGEITIKVHPEVSSVKEWRALTTQITVPIISTREGTTNIMIKDGQTIVMGGLVSETKTKTRKKVPILGDIPIISLAFSKREDVIERRELLVFLTPRIMQPTGQLGVMPEPTNTNELLGKSTKGSKVAKKPKDKKPR